MRDRSSHSRRLATLAVFAAFVTACGGDGKSSSEASPNAQQTANGGMGSCSNADTTPVALAVRDYIAKSSPTPQRFLAAQGTDSGLPDDGFKVLQDKGPTYFYSSDTSAQRQIREKLKGDGPYASLLIVYRGQQPAGDGAGTDVRLGSQYIGGELDGKRAIAKRYAVRCDSTGWRIASTTEEPEQ